MALLHARPLDIIDVRPLGAGLRDAVTSSLLKTPTIQLMRLVHSRFGLHVVEVIEREGGVAQSFESVQGAVTTALRQQTYVAALRQYLQLLAGQAVIEGVDLEAARSPLVQ